ncbi:hypothetical protein OG730_41470 (plasmid) [Streptomyces sp. NBC_01298]|uniref:hypothetical protein n=1 Tax=Streptomyces sp. NBC_01298 TaxID=2903817 RepID=UPI002E0D32FB|nr:hypothetical protein OG730_42555 [Streptomyces sp. NBC_01298]WSK25939.1 hypothetical protein OG730_41470 [Streptomyces sp. NBC_01298]
MSEPTSPLPEDLSSLLAAAGPDAVALVETDTGLDLVTWEEAPAPVVGETGLLRTRSTGEGVSVLQVCQGRREALLRWLELDDGEGQLALVTTGQAPAEHTPGELAARLLRDSASGDAELLQAISRWFSRRFAPGPQSMEAGWAAAAAAWTCHMRALADVPLTAVLSAARELAGDDGPATDELIVRTSLKLADLIDRMHAPHRTRADLVADWRTIQPLAAAVPALRAGADWLLDQIALRDAPAQQLRAVLEPDISDHLRDLRIAGGPLHAPGPALDAARTAQLAQARQTVRSYTAAFYSGRTEEADLLRNVFPAPARSLEASAPAQAWRQVSLTARHALEAVSTRRAAATAEDDTAYFADPERLHAESVYLTAWQGRIDMVHDALGRLAAPLSVPHEVPGDLREIALQVPARRLADAFGTHERALTALDGQISYLQQEPIPAHRRKATPGELALLTAVRDTVVPHLPVGESLKAGLDEDAIRRRVEQIMAATAAPATGQVLLPSVLHDHGLNLQQSGPLGMQP